MTDPSTFITPMNGVRSLINATGAPLVCPDVSDFPKSFYPSGDLPIDLDFNEGKNQLDALAEADIMSSELTYVIMKPCGLTMAVGAQKELTVGHDDNMTVMPNSIARAVACRCRLQELSPATLGLAPSAWKGMNCVLLSSCSSA